MTNREFLTAISTNSTLPKELTDFAVNAIASLDKRNEHRRTTPTKEQVANEAIKANIVALLIDKAMTASAIGSALGISTQKASALATQLVKDGKVAVEDIKVKGKGAVKSYSIKE